MTGAAQATPISISDWGGFSGASSVNISGDGKTIAYIYNGSLHTIPFQGGQDPKIIAPTHSSCASLVWGNDHTTLYFTATDPDKETSRLKGLQLWSVSTKRNAAPKLLTRHYVSIQKFKLAPRDQKILLIEQVAPKVRATGMCIVDGPYFKADGRHYLAERDKTKFFRTKIPFGETVQLNSGDFDDKDACWSPAGDRIAFIRKSDQQPAYQNDLMIQKVQRKPGAAKKLPTQTAAERGVPQWSPDGEKIAYLWKDETHGPFAVVDIAVYDVQAETETVVTRKILDRTVLSFTFSPDGRSLYIVYADSGAQHLARYNFEDDSLIHLVERECVIHSVDVDESGRIALCMTDGNRGAADVYTLDADKLTRMTDHNRGWFETKTIASRERNSFRVKGQFDVEAFVTKPTNFKKGKKYPAVMRLHGGPVEQAKCTYDFFSQFLAARGYVVIEPNPPGSLGRGQDYISSIRHHWGYVEEPDVLEVLDRVLDLGFVDPDRLAVTGYSYGGYMTNCLITLTDRFKAAAAGAGHSHIAANYGHDVWLDWYNWELGTPWENPDGYNRLSPLLRVDKVTTPTLYLHGTEDWNVPILNAELMYQSLQTRGIPTQLIAFPGADHADTGWTTEFSKNYYLQIVKWFDAHVLA